MLINNFINICILKNEIGYLGPILILIVISSFQEMKWTIHIFLKKKECEVFGFVSVKFYIIWKSGFIF